MVATQSVDAISPLRQEDIPLLTMLGLKRGTLQARMEKLGIHRARAAAQSQGCR
jgi:hypothetical protein